jgi:uncharacterized protein
MSMSDGILVAKGNDDLFVVPQMSNRHGLIAGATGTGKTVTLQTMAEGFSRIGVPIFMADVKGDLAGLSQAGGNNPNVVERAKKLGVNLSRTPCRSSSGTSSGSRDIPFAPPSPRWGRFFSPACSD